MLRVTCSLDPDQAGILLSARERQLAQVRKALKRLPTAGRTDNNPPARPGDDAGHAAGLVCLHRVAFRMSPGMSAAPAWYHAGPGRSRRERACVMSCKPFAVDAKRLGRASTCWSISPGRIARRESPRRGGSVLADEVIADCVGPSLVGEECRVGRVGTRAGCRRLRFGIDESRPKIADLGVDLEEYADGAHGLARRAVRSGGSPHLGGNW